MGHVVAFPPWAEGEGMQIMMDGPGERAEEFGVIELELGWAYLVNRRKTT